MRTAIVGIGSLGTIIGALMIKGGKQVDLFDSFQDNVDALNKLGATITGSLDLTVPVKAYTPEQMTGIYDLVFVLTKQTSNQAVLPKLLPHLRPESIVCTLQNGIPEDSVAAIVGADRTVGGAVGFGATWLKPGVSSLTSSYESVEKFAFEIGEIDGVIRPRLKTVQEYLGCIGRTEICPNVKAIKFTKVLMNATFSGMSAALACTFGDVLEHPKAMTCLAFIADECIKVAHARGVRLVQMQGSGGSRAEQRCRYSLQDGALSQGLGTAREAEGFHAAGPRKGPRNRDQLHQRRDLRSRARSGRRDSVQRKGGGAGHRSAEAERRERLQLSEPV